MKEISLTMIPAFLLDNGSLYHVANGCALTEYIIGQYFVPSWKAFPYVSIIGEEGCATIVPTSVEVF